MPAYATEADIEALHGVRFLRDLADRDDSGAADGPSVAAALELASAEVDSYLSMRYATPLVTVPAIVKTAAVEIAVYRLANDGVGRTEDMRKRYEDMIAWLVRVAKGQANLGIPALDTGATVGDAEFRPSAGYVGTATR